MRILVWLSCAAVVLFGASCGQSTPTPTSYVANCVVGLRLMSERDGSWAGAKAAPISPDIIEADAPQLIACAAQKSTGEMAAFRVRVQCANSIERGCTSLADPVSEARIDGARRASSGDFNSFTFAQHCTEALWVAGERGQVDPDRSALAFPWSIQGERKSDGSTIIRCAAESRDQPVILVAQVMCDDPDQDRCTQLASVEKP